MTGSAAAALSLAGAVLILPFSPRRRLAPRRNRATVPGRSGKVATSTAPVVIVLLCLLVGGPFVTLAAATLAATLTWRQRRNIARRRRHAESKSMEAGLDVLVSELRVGTHPVRAFVVAADETGGSVGAAFRGVAARATLGADVPAGLRAAAPDSARRADWERLAVFWQLAADHGLAIATLMRTAQLDMIERQRFSARVEAGMAGARATATILAGLPVLGIVLGQLMGASPVAFLTADGMGGAFLVVGVLLVCAGLLWADRITGQVLT